MSTKKTPPKKKAGAIIPSPEEIEDAEYELNQHEGRIRLPAEPEPEPEMPIAAPPPALEDRVAALEKANLELEKRLITMDRFLLRVSRDHTYEYGGTT